MEKIRGIKFDWTIRFDTLLVIGGLFISAGMLYQQVHTMNIEQDRMRNAIAVLDQRNNESHLEISKVLAGASEKLNLHIMQQK